MSNPGSARKYRWIVIVSLTVLLGIGAYYYWYADDDVKPLYREVSVTRGDLAVSDRRAFVPLGVRPPGDARRRDLPAHPGQISLEGVQIDQESGGVQFTDRSTDDRRVHRCVVLLVRAVHRGCSSNGSIAHERSVWTSDLPLHVLS